MRILVRCISNLGCCLIYILDIAVCLGTIGWYLPMIEMHWLSWEPLVRLKMKYRC